MRKLKGPCKLYRSMRHPLQSRSTILYCELLIPCACAIELVPVQRIVTQEESCHRYNPYSALTIRLCSSGLCLSRYFPPSAHSHIVRNRHDRSLLTGCLLTWRRYCHVDITTTFYAQEAQSHCSLQYFLATSPYFHAKI